MNSKADPLYVGFRVGCIIMAEQNLTKGRKSKYHHSRWIKKKHEARNCKRFLAMPKNRAELT